MPTTRAGTLTMPVPDPERDELEYVLKNFMRSQAHYLSAQSGQYIGMDLVSPAIDFIGLANSMGMPAKRITQAAEIHDQVREAIASCRPNLIEIFVGTE